MLEDFLDPRREGGRGTEISTLPGGQNLVNLLMLSTSRKNFIEHWEFQNPGLDQTLDLI